MKPSVLQRPIPSSGETLPVVGMGSWQTFDVGSSSTERQPLEEILARFVQLGGRVVDSSPMYGRAEEVIGDLAAQLKLRDSLFLATKVWTTGKEAGVRSMERSLARLQTKQLDLMQVHNLVDVQTQLATLREWKRDGRIRYIGITHYEAGGHAAVARLLESEQLDFVQINYSLGERDAEARILPLAQKRGVAVLVNRPFGGGELLTSLRGKPLPDFANDVGCHSWAQLCLKWIVAHPAVTCVIPATNKLSHLEDNMQAAVGTLPDNHLRDQIAAAIST